ncbi:unnamed protein product [Zymoseptoria tritici ST99CH_3D1]|nr:unnamed protein product [Zymoseptoria tritici ST99CH_3D1]
MLHRREIAFIDEKFSCESCNRNKLKQKFAISEPVRAQNPLTKVYMDLGGPLPDLISGEVYYLLIVDNYTRYGWLYTLKTKQAQEVYRCYYDFEIRMHRQFGAVIKEARADGGTEFTGIIANVAHAAGLHFTASVPYQSKQNGVVERKHQTLWNIIRCMKFDGQLKNQLWPELIKAALFINNRSPSTALYN